MKKALLLGIFTTLTLSQSIETHAQKNNKTTNNIAQDKIAQGLKEALNKGITDQVGKLALQDGFLKNELVKIVMPKELQKVDKALRKVGMGNLADQGLTLFNRAAEDAVKEAAPIFVDAVKNISFQDAKNILVGGPSSATEYLKQSTSQSLYKSFAPVVSTSLANTGADTVWEKMITAYNSLPLVTPANADLTDYITKETMDGVFKMIAVEENKIRENAPGARDSALLKEVFSIQDNAANTQEKSTITNRLKKIFK